MISGEWDVRGFAILMLGVMLSGCAVYTVGSAVTGVAGAAVGVAGTAVKVPVKVASKVVVRATPAHRG